MAATFGDGAGLVLASSSGVVTESLLPGGQLVRRYSAPFLASPLRFIQPLTEVGSRVWNVL